MEVERLASAVRDHRRAMGLTVEQFAGLAGIGVSTLRNIEAHSVARPQEDTLYKIDAAAGAANGTCLRILEGVDEAFPAPPSRLELELARGFTGLEALDVQLVLMLVQRLGA